MRVLEPPERARAVHDIGQPAPDALVLLRRLIRDVREDAEGRDIRKIPVRPERADVERVQPSRHDIPRCADGILGQPQRGGHVVDRAARDIAERRPLFIRQRHEAGDGLVERAVAAGADDQVILRAAGGDLTGNIPRAGGHVYGGLIAGHGEDLQYLHQRRADLCVSGMRVDEKQ